MIERQPRQPGHHRAPIVHCIGERGRRTYRLAPAPRQESAYRRLAVAILGLDIPTLAEQLELARTLRAAS